MDCPKQKISNDCGIFLFRYMYNIVTRLPMNFTQVIYINIFIFKIDINIKFISSLLIYLFLIVG
jgi:hypothetical protein